MNMSVDEMVQYVCARLKEERERKNMSQLDLARKAGVSQNMITYMETGKRIPSLYTVLRLSDALGINPVALFPSGDGDMRKEDAKKMIIELVERYM